MGKGIFGGKSRRKIAHRPLLSLPTPIFRARSNSPSAALPQQQALLASQMARTKVSTPPQAPIVAVDAPADPLSRHQQQTARKSTGGPSLATILAPPRPGMLTGTFLHRQGPP